MIEGFDEYNLCSTGDKSQSLRARDYKGGPCVTTYAFEGNGQRASHSGDGWCESDVMYTLNTIERHGVLLLRDVDMYSMANGSHTLELYGRNISPTLTQRMGTGGNQVPVFVDDKSEFWDGSQTCSTLTANNANGCQRMPDKIHFNCVIGVGLAGDKANNLDASYYKGSGSRGGIERTSVSYGGVSHQATLNTPSDGKVGTLSASDSKGKNGQDAQNKFPCINSRIRRLTPIECERLQGLADNYTDIESVNSRGKVVPASDSNRYKAIGNGMAQPCADFIIKQIVNTYR